MIRVAAAQCRPVPGDVAANLRLMNRLLTQAAAAAVDLVVFPEMVLTGYGIGAAAVAQLTEPADGPAARTVATLARRHGVAICYGYPEQVGPTSGPAFNSVTLLDSDGAPVASARKMHLFGPVDAEQFSPAPAAPSVARWRGWTVGLAICFDIEFPETTRLLAAQGADLVLVPTANMVGYEVVNRLLVPARAAENQLALVYANHTGADAMFEYNGQSVIVGPDGVPLAVAETTGAGETAEQLLIADLDPAQISAARADVDYLAQRRTDLY